MHEVLFIRELKPTLNVQSDSVGSYCYFVRVEKCLWQNRQARFNSDTGYSCKYLMCVEFLVVTDSNTQVVSECGSRYIPVSLLEPKLSDFTWPLANAERFLTINANNNQQSKKKMQNLIETTRRTQMFSLHVMTCMLWNFNVRSRGSSTRLNRFRNTLYTGQ